MIRIPSNIMKTLIRHSLLANGCNKQYFAKEAKPASGKDAKKGGKEQKKQEAPPAEEEATQKLAPHQKIIHYFTPLQPTLSPSQQKSLETKFIDLTQSDKEILDQLAEKITELNTTMFYDLVFRREALGTTEGFVVGSGKWEDDKVAVAIKVLRKDV